MENSFDPDLVHAIFKNVWSKKILERDRNEDIEILDVEAGAGTSKKHRPTTGYSVTLDEGYFAAELQPMTVAVGMACPYLRDAIFATRMKNMSTYFMGILVGQGANSNALKLSCELLQLFIRETVQRAAIIAEAEGIGKIEATHLERILPQLLLDF